MRVSRQLLGRYYLEEGTVLDFASRDVVTKHGEIVYSRLQQQSGYWSKCAWAAPTAAVRPACLVLRCRLLVGETFLV